MQIGGLPLPLHLWKRQINLGGHRAHLMETMKFGHLLCCEIIGDQYLRLLHATLPAALPNQCTVWRKRWSTRHFYVACADPCLCRLDLKSCGNAHGRPSDRDSQKTTSSKSYFPALRIGSLSLFSTARGAFRYPEIIKMEVDILVKHYGSPEVLRAFHEQMHRVTEGEMQWGWDVVSAVLSRLKP
jgi:hypothetical protein